jgi:pimeloyl-ACP methyl ester carboxylesterase
MRVVAAAIGLAFVACFGMPSCALGDSIPPGVGQQRVNIGRTVLTVYTYRPTHCVEPQLLLVFHGLNRNAADYRDSARWLADNMCLIVAAPEFDKEHFPTWAYQRGGIVHNGRVLPPNEWTVQYVPALIQRVQSMERRPIDVFMIGHSAGGQFLSRVAAFVPTVAKRIVVANPSTYVFPSMTPAPFGFGGVYPRSADETNLRRYLATPVTIFLGEEDTGDENRNDSDDAKQQGVTRLERGRNAFGAAQALARQRGWAFSWRLIELPGVGHSARKMFSTQEAVDALRP